MVIVDSVAHRYTNEIRAVRSLKTIMVVRARGQGMRALALAVVLGQAAVMVIQVAAGAAP